MTRDFVLRIFLRISLIRVMRTKAYFVQKYTLPSQERFHFIVDTFNIFDCAQSTCDNRLIGNYDGQITGGIYLSNSLNRTVLQFKLFFLKNQTIFSIDRTITIQEDGFLPVLQIARCDIAACQFFFCSVNSLCRFSRKTKNLRIYRTKKHGASEDVP